MNEDNKSHDTEQEHTQDDVTKPADSHISGESSVIADLLHVLGLKSKVHNTQKTDGKLEILPDNPVDIDALEPEKLLELPYSEDNGDGYSQNDFTISNHRKRTKLKIAIFILVGGIVLIKFAPYLLEPAPPYPDVVGSYNDKYITIEQLQKFISMEQDKEGEYLAHPVDSLNDYQQMVTMFAVEQMIQDWAEAKGITQREDVQHGMNDLLNDATVQQYISQLHDENIMPESISSWEVQQYYQENQADYTGKTLSEVEGEIRQKLAAEKDEDFFPKYIEELKKTAGLQVNFDNLKVTEPTEDEISEYYNENIAEYQTLDIAKYMEIRIKSTDISLSATDAIRKIRSGESFESVATNFSQDGKIITNTIERGSGEANLEAVIWKMKIGEISDPIVNSDGSSSIIKLLEYTKAGAKPLSAVKSDILNILISKNMEREYTLRKSEMLFSIHSRRYTLGEFYVEFNELSDVYQSEFLTFETKKQLVEQMIARELLLEKSADKSSSANEEHGYEEMKIQYLSQILHKDEVDGKLAEPNEEEIRQFYQENKESMVIPATVQLNLIWIDQGQNGEKKEQALKKANEALATIKGGTSFAEVAKQYSEDASADFGGQIEGELYEDYLIPPLAKAAFELKVGDVSQVLEYSNGYYILQVRDRTEAQQQSYEEAYEGIKNHINELQHEQLEMEMEKTMLDNANFTIYNKTIRSMLKKT